MIELGIVSATGKSVNSPLPQSWLGRSDAPIHNGTFGQFTDAQVNNMLGQLAYTCTMWDTASYNLTDYTAGRYNATTAHMTDYGLLNPSFVKSHGNSSMTYTVAWTGKDGLTDLVQFLLTPRAQDQLAFWTMQNNYTELLRSGAITETDSLSVVAGILFVAYLVGSGSAPTQQNPQGTGAYQWRFYSSTDSRTFSFYNAGRYAIEVLASE